MPPSLSGGSTDLFEPEYGRINILSTDHNSYVLTPTANGEAKFDNWMSCDDTASDDGAGDETTFISQPERPQPRENEILAPPPEKKRLMTFVRV